jgi:predicted transposase YdaD
MFQEAKMLQSIEEVGIEKGIEQGIEKGIEKGIEQGVEQEKEATAKKLLLSQWLTKEQISEITGLDREKLEKLENKLKFE